MIASSGGQNPELTLLGDVARGAYELADFSADDVATAIAVIERYADLRLGLADASIECWLEGTSALMYSHWISVISGLSLDPTTSHFACFRMTRRG